MQALWMVLASFWFALMAVGIKYASNSFGTFELVFYRGLVSIVFMGIVVRASGSSLRTSVPMMHVWRSTIGVVSLGSWFYAIAHLPLATAMTLNYMSGVWVAAFVVGGALLYGKEQPQGALLGTVLLGFVGVVLTLRPTIDQNQLFAGIVGLLSGLGAALAYMQVTALGKAGEPEARTVFYFSVGSAVVGAAGMGLTGITPWSKVAWQDAAWVIPIGILASLGQWCMTRAYRKGATLVVASMQYSGIVFGVFFSLVLFGDQIPPLGWLGIAVIVSSGILATILRTRLLPHTPAEEH
ncbi:MAG: DMT family transporter [Rhodoferax sp.]|uniref:DMT family transporter n=1 Tax=Rhodoferax sp. TaxID=50421 RepID=UPI002ACDBC4E|nr:DMT family transporter [Rhodoferax sp.]MDZ7891697.1 DMT family transporter [Rhodoferax sp.]